MQLWSRKQFVKLWLFKIVKTVQLLFASTYMVWNFLTYLRFKATSPRILRPTAFSGHKLQFTARSCQGNFCLFRGFSHGNIWTIENIKKELSSGKYAGGLTAQNQRDLVRARKNMKENCLVLLESNHVFIGRDSRLNS